MLITGYVTDYFTPSELHDVFQSFGIPSRDYYLVLNKRIHEVDPETLALLSLVHLFPWLAEVAFRDFHPEAAQEIFKRETCSDRMREAFD